MSFDGIFTHALVDELNQVLTGGQVNKIHQPYANEIVLVIRNNRTNYKLLISAHPQYARLHVTEIPYENPAEPPQFAMVLRKYLSRARLESIDQVENDRIVIFNFKNRDELGDDQDIQLIAEIMGRHSNILLINRRDQRIIDLIRHVGSDQNSYRTLLPGAPFVHAPRQDQYNPFDTNKYYAADQRLKNGDFKNLSQAVQKTFQGFGRDTAKEIAYRARGANDQVIPQLQAFLEDFKNSHYQPQIVDVDGKLQFTPVNYLSYSEYESQLYPDFSSMLDDFYGNKAQRDRVHQLTVEIDRLLKNEYDKNQRKLKKQDQELAETDRLDLYRVQGEVLTAYMHTIEPGDAEAILPNFYADNEDIKIDLDPSLSPSENAQKYFSRYNKMKKRKAALTQQIQETKNEIAYLDSVLTQLAVASPEDIDDIRQELIDQNYLKKRQKKGGNKQNKALPPRQYYSSDGTLIQVGRNNKQNDQLTMRTANKEDTWLHIKDQPGSHVLIRSDQPSEETLLEAAEIAAYYSKDQASSNVPVDYTLVKHVRKPNGAKPGFVIYDHQQTLYVTPSARRVKAMEAPKDK